MFFHSFKYNFIVTMRDRSLLFWSLIFTMILGTLFKTTFGDIYEKEEMTRDIKVAVYVQNDAHIEEMFKASVENLEVRPGVKLLAVEYMDSMQDAEKKLDDEDVCGILYAENGILKLKVTDAGISQSILETIALTFKESMVVSTKVYEANPKKANDIIKENLIESVSTNEELFLTNGSTDVYRQYFYNLIAMACLFACYAGLAFALRSQANLSTIGARKSVSDSRNFVEIFAGLSANIILLYVVVLIAFGYLNIIGVDFGDKIFELLLVIFVGTFLGVSFGYFVGSLGKISRNSKEALVTLFSLLCCFLSGLMVGDMKMIIDDKCPIINKINPAAVLTDAFYSLEIYDTNDRFYHNIIVLIAMSLICMVIGVLLGRRKKYASL